MAIIFPPKGSTLRAELDIEHAVEALDPANVSRLPTLQEAKRSARETIERSEGLIRSVRGFVLRANGDRELIEFGPRGGRRTLWNFSAGRVTSRVG